MKKKIFTVLGALLIICVPTITVLAGGYSGKLIYNGKKAGDGYLSSYQYAFSTDKAWASTTSIEEDLISTKTYLKAEDWKNNVLASKTDTGQVYSCTPFLYKNCRFFVAKCTISGRVGSRTVVISD